MDVAGALVALFYALYLLRPRPLSGRAIGRGVLIDIAALVLLAVLTRLLP
jgi:hypothetical protein